MADRSSAPPPDTALSTDRETPRASMRTLVGLCLLSGVLFGIGLQVTESVGEIVLDVDLKPFVLPYLLISVVRFRTSVFAIGTGAALGESVLDVLEGYELDDPIGFIGYVFGFAAFGWYLRAVAEDATNARSQTVAAVLGAVVQATFEGLAFLFFSPTAGPVAAAVSILGNTVTHGLLLGAVPLVVLAPSVRRRFGTLD